ncbi:secretory phospholipase A2 receptor-like [Penaeus monodon]|uniref:secretory phospholipase A2 receptor-like n=1 Tax=Penaeus monodon TaxID=6687 RepID=UPI0018A72831|nr:secretory phospholipase A2 receptor-like [Penaeus monodon]
MALSTMKPGGKAVLVPLSLALLVVRADIDINNFITSLNHLRTTMEEYVGCDQRMEKLWEDIMTRNKMFNHLNERLLSKMDQLAKIRERDEIQSECKPPFQVFRGYCLLLNTVSSLDWPQARFVCWVKGGDLAYPWSLQDLKDFLPKTGREFWVGARTLPELEFAEWKWADGRLVESDHELYTAIPQARAGDKCIMLARNGTFKLMAANCETRRPFVCQIPYRKHCPRSYTDVGGRCVKLHKVPAASWADADDLCREDDAELARPRTALDTRDFVGRQLQADWRVWIGGEKREKRSAWKWTNGSPLSFPDGWHHRDTPPGQCLALLGADDFESETAECHTALPFLCQRIE